jgi:ABC-type bacteriocin/lantibiotic exporter with double-glycine peptidase domain
MHSKPKPNEEHPIKTILRSPDLRHVMPGLATSSLMSNLLALALPLAMLQIFDRVLANHSLETLTLITIGVILAIIIEQVLRVINGQVTSWLGARWEQKTSFAALDRLLHISLQRFFKQEPSVYTDRISAASKISNFYSGQALMVLFDLPFVIVFLTLTGLIGGWMVLAPIILLLLFSYVEKPKFIG